MSITKRIKLFIDLQEHYLYLIKYNKTFVKLIFLNPS